MASKVRTEHTCLKAVTAKVDWAALGRLEAKAKAHLATLTPERRAQLEAEWDA